MESSTPCGFCDQVFLRKQDYYEHNNNDHYDIVSELWEGCPKCPKYYPTRVCLTKHKMRFHSRKGGSKMPQHEDSVNSQTCDFCSEFFPRKAQYYSHVNEAHRELICNSWAVCQDCLKFFPTKRIRDRHRHGFKKRGEMCAPTNGVIQESTLDDDIEEADTSFSHEFVSCEIEEGDVDDSFADPHFLASAVYDNGETTSVGDEGEHMDEMAESRDDIIELDDDDLPNHDVPVSSIFESTNAPVCQFCQLTFFRKQDYYDHGNKEHPHEVSLYWKGCNKCGRFYPSSRVLNNHRAKAHSSKNNPPALEKQTAPLIVAETLTNKLLNNSPVENSEPPSLTCNFCRLVLSRKQDLYDHVNTKHLDEISDVWISCSDCMRFYPTRKALHNHVEKAHRRMENVDESVSKGEPCAYCSMTFSRRDLLYRHMNDSHVEEISQIWIPCHECQRFFPNRRTLNRHKEKFRSRGETCKPKYALDGQEGSPHTEVDHPPADRYITCTFCSLILQREQDYYTHANKEHGDELPYVWHQCDECSRFYPNRRSLKKHRQKSHRQLGPSGEASAGSRGEPCNFCSERFTRKELFYSHVNDNHLDLVKESWVPCPECSKFFPAKWICDRHRDGFRARGESCARRYASAIVETILADPKEAEDENSVSQFVDCEMSDENLSGSDPIVCCDFCEDSFFSAQELYEHVNTEHLDIISDSWKSCNRCKRFFPSQQVADEHKISGHCRGLKTILSAPTIQISKVESLELKPGKVRFDMKSETSRPPITIQKLIAKPGKLQCAFCDQNFGKEQHYYRHVSDVHHEEASKTWVSCDGCRKLFPSKDVCARHKKKAQLRGMPCNPEGVEFCDLCSMSFSRKEAYYKHANDEHKNIICLTWEQCDECYRHYPSRAVLNSHKLWYRSVNRSCNKVGQTDHEETEDCSHCQVSFPVNSGLLLQHLSLVHGVEDTAEEDTLDVSEDWLEQDLEEIAEEDESSEVSLGKVTKNKVELENRQASHEVETLDDCLMEGGVGNFS